MSKPNNDRFRPTTDDRALEETEAHRFTGSDPSEEHDGKDVPGDDEDGTEGHGLRVRV